MARLILLLLLIGCNTTTPESELVSDAATVVDEMPPSPEKRLIKSTLNMCSRTIADQDKEITRLQKAIDNLSEELAETKEKAGQVDLLNKILWVAISLFFAYIVIQFLPLLKKFI